MDRLHPQQFLALVRESGLSVEETGSDDRLLVHWKQDRHAFTIRVRLIYPEKDPGTEVESFRLCVRHVTRVPVTHPKALVVYQDLLELRTASSLAEVRYRSESGEIQCRTTEWLPRDMGITPLNRALIVGTIRVFASDVVRVRKSVRRAIRTGKPARQRRREWLDRGIARLFSDSIDQHASRPEAVAPPIDTPTA